MYEVPASKKSAGQNKWSFKIKDKTYSLPKVKYLSGFQMEDLTSNDLARVYSVIGDRGTAIGDAVRGLDQEQAEALVLAWIADSEVTPGESKAS